MDRRTVLKGLAGAGSLAATGGLSMPALSQGAAARTLRFVPQANLANFDPIWGTQYVVRNAAALVWDTLYGVDATLQPQRQMVESEEVSDDGLIWTFRLRPGLKFHDGEPVLSKDVVASLARWSARDPMGLMLKAIQNELTAVDDRTFKWVLKQPYPKMLLALGKNNYALRLHHAGAHRPDRSVQADHRICRLGPDEVRQERVGARRQGGVREIRRLRAAAGEGVLARRRQADAGRPRRMGGDPGSRPRRRPRCRTARSIGGRIRSPISCRC